MSYGYIAFNMATSKSYKDVSEKKSEGVAELVGFEKGRKFEKSQPRESTLDRHSSVSVMTMFCYCWSLFFKGQKTGH